MVRLQERLRWQGLLPVPPACGEMHEYPQFAGAAHGRCAASAASARILTI